MTDQDIIAKGIAAQELLRNDLLQEAFSILEKEVIEAWEACPVRDTDGREELWRLYKTAKKFRGIFVATVEAGKFAEAQLREPTLKDRVLRKVNSAFS